MQSAYSAYPYNARTPYPAHYYPPQTVYANPYPNGGRDATTNIYADWPKIPPPQNAGTSRSRQERNSQRQPNGPGNTPMPRPKQISTREPRLKSAMKRPGRSVSDPVGQLERTRTISDPMRTLNPMTRTRTSSNAAKDIPGLFCRLRTPENH
jgi:hypothetical protein